jgi:hypothetical protein
MAGTRLVYVKADDARVARERARLRAREALRSYNAAADEYEAAMVDVERVIGPDPRLVIADAAVEQFVGAVSGRPSIPSR